MTLYEFTGLDINSRADCLWSRGRYLDAIRSPNYSYSLFELNGFYVEVEIDQILNEIISITPFKTGERLEKYLDNINLNPG